MAGVMLLSQPAYAASEADKINEIIETDIAGEEDDTVEDVNTSDESANQEMPDSTSSVLSWNGAFYQNQDAEINVSYESGDDIDSLGVLQLNNTPKEAETEICKKLNRK